jgi:hypothetical protein
MPSLSVRGPQHAYGCLLQGLGLRTPAGRQLAVTPAAAPAGRRCRFRGRLGFCGATAAVATCAAAAAASTLTTTSQQLMPTAATAVAAAQQAAARPVQQPALAAGGWICRRTQLCCRPSGCRIPQIQRRLLRKARHVCRYPGSGFETFLRRSGGHVPASFWVQAPAAQAWTLQLIYGM